MKKVLLIPKHASLEKEITSQISEIHAGKVSRSIGDTKAGWILVSSDKNEEIEARSSSDWVVYPGVIPDKKESIVLDYAGNIEKHCPSGDLYAPQIKAAYQGTGGEPIEATCEGCNRINVFSARKNDEGFDIDAYGYFTDLTGERITTENHKGEKVPLPAHHGRRCQHVHLRTGERCDYYWSCKVCPVCEHANDIAARYCSGCKAELINPADKLIEIHTQHKKDPTLTQCDELLDIEYTHGISRSGNDMITATITTPRRKFPVYLLENSTWTAAQKHAFAVATDNFKTVPRTISYRKNKDGFWSALGFDMPTDEELLREKLGGGMNAF